MFILQNIFAETTLKRASQTSIKIETKGQRSVVVYFRDDQCMKCNTITTMLENLQNQYKGILPILIANCSDNKTEPLCKEYRAKRFPHMIMINPNKGGKEESRPETFVDDWEKPEIREWFMDSLKKPFTHAKQAEGLSQAIIDLDLHNKTASCFFFVGEDDIPLWAYRTAFKGLFKDGFTSFALTHYDDAAYDEISKTQIGPYIKKASNSFVCAKDGKWHIFDNEFSETGIRSYINKLNRPLKKQVEEKSDI